MNGYFIGDKSDSSGTGIIAVVNYEVRSKMRDQQ
jgi:hypothetical protein